MNTRRKFVASVTVVVMFTLGLAIEGQSQEGRSARTGIEGSWRVSVMLGPNRPPTSSETVEALATYDAGGGFIFTDDQPNPTSPTPGHGAWESGRSLGRFNTTQVRFILNPLGQLVATLHVRSKITLNFAQDEYTADEDVEIRQFPSGVVLAAFNGATAVGKRIRVE
jgi:hypothetical protein